MSRALPGLSYTPCSTRPCAQGHADVAKLCVSPGGAAAASVESSPCDSVRSLTLVCNYGSDMNRDLAVITTLEDKLSREVDHCELQACITQFVLVHGHQPTVRQLALALGYAMLDAPVAPDCCSGLDQDVRHSARTLSPAPSSSPNLPTTHGSSTTESRGVHRMPASCSPSTRRRSLPVRSLFASDMCTPDASHGHSPLAPQPAAVAGPGGEGQGSMNPADPTRDQPFTPAPLARPVIPGLNLYTVKKRSPVVRNCARCAWRVSWGATPLGARAHECSRTPMLTQRPGHGHVPGGRCVLLQLQHETITVPGKQQQVQPSRRPMLLLRCVHHACRPVERPPQPLAPRPRWKAARSPRAGSAEAGERFLTAAGLTPTHPP